MPGYVCLDVETSGLFDFSKPADADGQPRLASLALVFLDADLNEERVVDLLVQPDGWEMPEEASKINGLTMERLLAEGVPVSVALDRYVEAIDDGRIVVAYNAQFDTKILRGELRRAGRPDRFEDTPNICCMRASTDVVRVPKANGRGFKFPKLSEACEHFGVTLTDAHTALGDARACGEILRGLAAAGRLPEAGVRYAKNRPESQPVAAADLQPAAAPAADEAWSF